MKRSWIGFYIDECQSRYFYDTENNKMYKCPNDFNFPTWSIYVVLLLGAVMGDILNRLFIHPKNEVIVWLLLAVVLAIGCAAVYLIMKYISKMIDKSVYELKVSSAQMNEYVVRGRKKFKRDILIISITIGVGIIIWLLSVWLFFIFNNTHILMVTALTWVLILLCGFSFQPIKRYKLYKNGIVNITKIE